MYCKKKKQQQKKRHVYSFFVQQKAFLRLILVLHYFARTLSSRFVSRSREKSLASTVHLNPAAETLPNSGEGKSRNPSLISVCPDGGRAWRRGGRPGAGRVTFWSFSSHSEWTSSPLTWVNNICLRGSVFPSTKTT